MVSNGAHRYSRLARRLVPQGVTASEGEAGGCSGRRPADAASRHGKRRMPKRVGSFGSRNLDPEGEWLRPQLSSSMASYVVDEARLAENMRTPAKGLDHCNAHVRCHFI